jgi:hypothetical protein
MGILGNIGVDNAVRTRDLLNHNQMLYLLSYIHHVALSPVEPDTSNRWILYMIRTTCAYGESWVGAGFWRKRRE